MLFVIVLILVYYLFVTTGLKVMVTHVERLMPSSEFLEFLVRPSGSRTPGVIRPVRPSHPEFHLSFSTPLSVRALLRGQTYFYIVLKMPG